MVGPGSSCGPRRGGRPPKLVRSGGVAAGIGRATRGDVVVGEGGELDVGDVEVRDGVEVEIIRETKEGLGVRPPVPGSAGARRRRGDGPEPVCWARGRRESGVHGPSGVERGERGGRIAADDS